MAEAKRQHDWHIASSVMALTAEINRDRRRRRKPFKPDDFNPYTATKSVPVKVSVEQVASLLGTRFFPSSNSPLATSHFPCPKSEPEPPMSNC